MIGVRMVSIESMARKTATPASLYARSALAEEVDSQLPAEIITPALQTVKEDLIEFLEGMCNEHIWPAVLMQAGLDKSSKKDAELFINAYSALVVAPYTYQLLQRCIEVTRDLRRRYRFRGIWKDLSFLRSTAEEIVAKYPGVIKLLSSWKSFESRYKADLDALYKSLEVR